MKVRYPIRIELRGILKNKRKIISLDHRLASIIHLINIQNIKNQVIIHKLKMNMERIENRLRYRSNIDHVEIKGVKIDVKSVKKSMGKIRR